VAGVAVFFAIDTRRLGLKNASLGALTYGVSLALALPLAYVVMGIVWPWSVLAPLNPIRAIEYYSHFWEKPWKDLFEGSRILITEMPRTYVPLLCLLKLPEILSRSRWQELPEALLRRCAEPSRHGSARRSRC
jgi:hypothetical protein